MRPGRVGGKFEVDTSAPRWLTTYSDLMTNLLCFFVMLFAMSTLNVKKFKAVLMSIQGAFGVLPGQGITIEELREQVPGLEESLMEEIARRDMEQLESARQALEGLIQQEGLGASVSVTMESRGLVLRFADTVLFDLGKADLKPGARQILDKVSKVLKDLPNHVRVEGHTDNLPISTPRFPSNWELSCARATNVVRYLIEANGLSPERLSAAGYGEFRPVSPNDSEASRRLNRRVDLVVLTLTLSRSETGNWR
ncbi:MAG: OmpA/MotB family protein [Bacillota bacterium]